MDGTILVADDDRTIRTVLTQALTRAGCKVHATSSLTTLMRWVGEGIGDVVISDVAMPDGNGLEMLPKIALDRPDLPVIVISAQNTIMTAIKAAEAEAFDYLPKPFDLPDLMKRTAIALERRGRPAKPAPRKRPPPGDLPLIGRSAPMQALYRQVAGAVNAAEPLLIMGESGTGKTLLARSLHHLSERSEGPLVAVGPDDLTAERAAALVRSPQATVLIEALGDLPLAVQGILVRMMDAGGAPGPRFIATALGPLDAQLEAGTLRRDLYYRISAMQLHLPPLRARPEDIALLADHFLARLDPAPGLEDRALEALRHCAWPGNVRQLENTINALAAQAQGGVITADQVTQTLGRQAPQAAIGRAEPLSDAVARHIQRYFDLHEHILPPAGLYQRILREVEAPLIDIALSETGGNQAKCAALLGINRNTLRKKILELDIEVTRRRKLM